ncbi:glycosyltransferase family 4 protein [Vibrio parahaemolyticus]|uniref:GDP-mannose-dependent alpha-mannosyltransferase n=1 Tax=Vibrio parahaemolyticus TaxID=670 RepID=A0A7M1VLQ1_VIBPH|nr:glycosyltransferase family 4 protein [Vibrio parahaemolyticus]EGQ7828674.1 glycosyltransferase family 4 protein [Vibrio parahaemolyticus]EGQ9825679.1 glycosyltransferase family 4 protein [Vibrio parahaemolyticus]EGR0255033.1 glycosyltransferase family 4 protein [Vibrio parahaemolyticus]EHR6655489.1 glycosyltransferase family 4 protein [Vibrio parahaemolyticus]EJB0376060.1 glycosyltransferase family 4 protein [Vibrio parahaemolyticus]
MKLLVSQRVPAFFRKPFFEALGQKIELVVTAGEPLEGDSIKTFDSLNNGVFIKSNIKYFFRGMFWFDLDWKKNIQSCQPDRVVLTPTPRMLSNYLVIRYCKRHSIKVIGWGMGEMPGMGKLKAFFHLLILKTLVSRLDCMISYSSTAQKHYLNAGMTQASSYIAYNSTDTAESKRLLAEVQLGSEIKEKVLKKLGLSSDSVKLLFVGRLTKSKRVDDLILSLSKIKSNVELIIVGDGVYKSELEKIANKSQSKIIFTGHKIGYELAELFYISDIFILPSLGGLAIQQAMSYGLPVVVSIGDGTEKDLVTDNYNGRIFESGNFDSMASAVDELIEDGQLVNLGKNSLSLIENRFNIEAMVKDYLIAVG